MPYAALADLIVLIHLAFVLFVVLDGLLVLRWPRIAWIHIPAVLWAIALELSGWLCPLTPLENRLRVLSGGDDYRTSFIEHYILPLLYPASLTRSLQLLLGVFVLVVNAVIYGLMLRRSSNAIRKRAPSEG